METTPEAALYAPTGGCQSLAVLLPPQARRPSYGWQTGHRTLRGPSSRPSARGPLVSCPGVVDAQ
eukprot:9437353-Prorocentrum_lima.AAC.1